MCGTRTRTRTHTTTKMDSDNFGQALLGEPSHKPCDETRSSTRCAYEVVAEAEADDEHSRRRRRRQRCQRDHTYSIAFDEQYILLPSAATRRG